MPAAPETCETQVRTFAGNFCERQRTPRRIDSTTPMNLFRKRLPPVPTGFEHLDLLWSQLIPDADSYVAILPRSANPAWATEHGLRFVATSLLKQWAASDELQRTPNRSTLRRVRERHLRLMEKQYQGQALTLIGALVDQARETHPKAPPAQLLTVARDAFKDLLRATFPADGGAPARGQRRRL